MKTTVTKNNDGSNGGNKRSKIGNSKSKLNVAEALWLIKVRRECIVFIHEQDEKFSWEDAEDIFSGQVKTLVRRGFRSLYSQKTKMAIELGLVLSDADKLAILKDRLKKRVLDHFRTLQTEKAGHLKPVCECGKKRCKCETRQPGFHRIVEISHYQWNQIPDQRTEFKAERRIARNRLDELNARVRKHLNPKDRAILDAAIRNPRGQFKRTPLYEAMTEQERELFLPGDGKLAADEKEHVKSAIAARTADVRRKIRRIFASDPGKDEG